MRRVSGGTAEGVVGCAFEQLPVLEEHRGEWELGEGYWDAGASIER